MKVREVSTTLTAALQDRFGHPARTPGLHASQIWSDIMDTLNLKKKGGALNEDKLRDFGTVGFLWEKVLETTLATMVVEDNPGRYMRPGEQIYEGVLWTPDYIDLDFFGDGGYVTGLEEWKVKWCSCNKGDDLEKNFWEWLVQTKGYCKVLGLNHARIRAVFIVGDWRNDIAPRLREWELGFTDRELDENMAMLLGHARRKKWL